MAPCPPPADAAAELLFTRRENLLALLPAFLAYALLGEARAAAPERQGSVRRWIASQQGIAEALASGAIGGRAWCLEVERLAAELDLAELVAELGRARLRPAGPPFRNDPSKRHVSFLDESGAPRRLAYGAALFDFDPANVITPHGHRHMVSAHLVVAGAFRVRNFDRLRDEGEAMVIRPTRDYLARPGRVSTMCSERDNIHWFVPQGGPATTFDVVVSGLDPGLPDHDIKAVDPLGGRRLADGSILAPLISFADSSRRYTAAV
ncbi:MAG TPA: hypothetical protein VN231_04030 [Allosphingosinicella sp.]|nr:hypothetical protein [Allosphingosinicella sp.]